VPGGATRPDCGSTNRIWPFWFTAAQACAEPPSHAFTRKANDPWPPASSCADTSPKAWLIFCPATAGCSPATIGHSDWNRPPVACSARSGPMSSPYSGLVESPSA
jgi:hypothetical protein